MRKITLKIMVYLKLLGWGLKHREFRVLSSRGEGKSEECGKETSAT